MRRTLPLLTLTTLAGSALLGGAAAAALAQDADDKAGTLEKLDRSLQTLVEKASPAVVRLDVERTLSLKVVAGTAQEKKRLEDALNRYAPVESVTATGFLVDDEGHVVTTAAAVGPRANKVRATFSRGTERTGRFMGADELAGVALVKVEPVDGVEPLNLRDECPRVGSITVLLGHAGKRDPVVRWGLLSGASRAIGNYDAYVLSSVDVRPGDAGGPLLDVR
ncbi:MAG: S1 family peptidase, partial [Planctomycetota bacterium]